ncbi:hypothetical protein OG320_02630 [Microbispora sp. NBC_01189]|uniref:hypothetical protein n=1 Tax=Microbispora sp. NBC_01189 TaxID=2903583 RepID=UPI002E0E69FC|nr:hypothetical protein OG320_02630 [Microbispora sp. NBC_01189]
MTRDQRPRGRHRDGTEPGVFLRRAWDLDKRAEARRMAAQWPDWTVLYGPGSRRFYAMAAWPVPEPLILEASTAVDLDALLRQETLALVRDGGPS